MPSVAQKREAIKKAYLSPNWEEKVDKMPDKQVHSVYQRLLNQKKI